MADIIDVNIGDSTLEVFWQDEVELNLDMALMYIKSGEAEIQNYVDNVSKPEISDYVETEAKPLVTQIVNEIAEPTVMEYIEGTVKPEIDEYVEDKKPELQAYVTQASGYADNSQASATASAASAAASLTSANNAKTSETNAKTYENNALSSKNAAASSATSASNYANNSKIWAEGTDAQVQALGGTKSAKGWAEASTNLDYTNITNCITAIPQDIKLELNNGTLTLKAGSKVYIPNGAGKFDVVTVQSDTSTEITFSGSYDDVYVVLQSSGAFGLIGRYSTQASSGETDSISGIIHIWYDTTNNKIKRIEADGSYNDVYYSFPIGIFSNKTNQFTSIDQVFNGFGYIGSHWYELKGNEGKARNGRNADGSLNNSTRTTTKVIVHACGGGTGNWFMMSGFDDNFRNAAKDNYFVQDEMPFASSYSGNYAVWESPRENIIRFTSNKGVTWTKVLQVNCGEYSTVDGRITSFKPKTTIQATDYYDFKQLDDSAAKLAANNTFTGVNTFEAEGYGRLIIKNLNMDLVNGVSSEYNAVLRVLDKNDKVVGDFYAAQKSSESFTQMVAYNSSGQYCNILARITPDGTKITQCPTPATTDNSTQIATTAFVNNFFNTPGRVAGKCLPNYAAPVSVGFPLNDSKFTAPSKGVYMVYACWTGTEDMQAYVNNRRIATGGNSQPGGSFYNQGCSAYIPLDAGDVLYFSHACRRLFISAFYPFKG